MVRINLIEPKKLSDQHLIAEYNEIMMLLGYIKKYPIPTNMPKDYTLNKGHMKFFKNKLLYLKKRHNLLKKEMIKRDFNPKKELDINSFHISLKNDWTPNKNNLNIIKERIKEKIDQKPNYYKYYKKIKPKEFFIDLLK